MRTQLFAGLMASAAMVEAQPDKSAWHLFSPTPRDQMRELSTDRPDLTESPYTVDAGHWQLEMDLLHWTHDSDAGAHVDAVNVAPLNLKLGLTNITDVQVVFDSWSQEHIHGQQRFTRQGWGDLTLRLKQNLWGNDGGTTALAVMPFVTLPLHASELGRDDAEAGIILPFGINLPHDLSLGLMTEWDWINDDTGGHRHAWFNSITLGFPITKHVGGYLEWATTVCSDNDPWQATVDAGLTFGISDNLQLDLGCNLGVTRSAPDVQPFIGMSYRY